MCNVCWALRMQTCRQQAVNRMALCLPLKAGHTLPTSVEKELHLGKAAVAAKKAVLMRKRPFAVGPTKDHLVRSTDCLCGLQGFQIALGSCCDKKLDLKYYVMNSILVGLTFWLAIFFGCLHILFGLF